MDDVGCRSGVVCQLTLLRHRKGLRTETDFGHYNRKRATRPVNYDGVTNYASVMVRRTLTSLSHFADSTLQMGHFRQCELPFQLLVLLTDKARS